MQSSNGGRRRGPETPAGPQEAPGTADVGAAGQVRLDDPWYDSLASGWGELDGTGAAARAVPSPRHRPESGAVACESRTTVPESRTAESCSAATESRTAAAEVYLEVQRSAAFQEVQSRYRRFVVPAVAVFFTWYVAYVVTAISAPGLMARPVAGAVNVAMVSGLGQFLTTFLFTWAYARHARLRRDRAALELRWDTQELTRTVRGGAR